MRWFGWLPAAPIVFPGGEYITMFALKNRVPDTNGARAHPLANGNKLCGVLPRHALLPALVPETASAAPASSRWLGRSNVEMELLPFFPAATADDVQTRLRRATDGGGAVVMPPFNADGTVAIARDCGGAYFAAYHRTDVPSEVKPRTALADLSTFH
jgi:hypothetical protein